MEIDYKAAGESLSGKAVLVRHEFPFTTGHTHRYLKYRWAIQAGAAAFLISNNNPMGGPVTGGSGTGQETDIPAVGLSYEAGQLLRTAASYGEAKIELNVRTHKETWSAQNLVLDIPGATDEWVLVGAHMDGHEIAESAMDNATGMAAVLEVGRRLAPMVPSLKKGLRLVFFTVEEWGLTGSARYVQQLSQQERDKITLTVILDSITGHPRLSALTGDNKELDADLIRYAKRGGNPIDVVRPVLLNSDHYSFQNAGMPAARFIAGYGREESLTRFLLTPADTRAMVEPTQLKSATLTIIELVHQALSQ